MKVLGGFLVLAAVFIVCIVGVELFLQSQPVPISLTGIIAAAKNPVNPVLDSATVNAWFKVRSYFTMLLIVAVPMACGFVAAAAVSRGGK